MKQSSKRLLSSTLALALVFLAFFMYATFIRPAYAELTRLRGEVDARKALLEQQKVVADKVQQLLQLVNRGGTEREAINLALPTEPKLAEAFLQLSGLTQLDNLVTQGFTVSAPELQQRRTVRPQVKGAEEPILRPVASITFQVNLSGTYDDLKSFLEKLETNIRIFDIERIQIQSDANPQLYKYSLTITTYYQN